MTQVYPSILEQRDYEQCSVKHKEVFMLPNATLWLTIPLKEISNVTGVVSHRILSVKYLARNHTPTLLDLAIKEELKQSLSIDS